MDYIYCWTLICVEMNQLFKGKIHIGCSSSFSTCLSACNKILMIPGLNPQLKERLLIAIIYL